MRKCAQVQFVSTLLVPSLTGMRAPSGTTYDWSLIICELTSPTHLQPPRENLISSKEGFKGWGLSSGGGSMELSRSWDAFCLVKKQEWGWPKSPPILSPDPAPRTHKQGRVHVLCSRTE